MLWFKSKGSLRAEFPSSREVGLFAIKAFNLLNEAHPHPILMELNLLSSKPTDLSVNLILKVSSQKHVE